MVWDNTRLHELLRQREVLDKSIKQRILWLEKKSTDEWQEWTHIHDLASDNDADYEESDPEQDGQSDPNQTI